MNAAESFDKKWVFNVVNILKSYFFVDDEAHGCHTSFLKKVNI